MNCCDPYGHCTQGQDCPCREAVHEEQQARRWIGYAMVCIGAIVCAGLLIFGAAL